MILVLSGAQLGHHPKLFERLIRLRHDTFVLQPAAFPACYGELEPARYDTPQATYFIDLDKTGEIYACTRVMRTSDASLLADYFPYLVEADVALRDPDIYEATRYVVVSEKLTDQDTKDARARIFVSVFEWCVARNARYLQTIVNKDELSKFVTMSMATRPLGMTHDFGGGVRMPGGGQCLALRWPVTTAVLNDILLYPAKTTLPSAKERQPKPAFAH